MKRILKINLADAAFEIRTPVVDMNKERTMEVGYELSVLQFLLGKTNTCYEGFPYTGCTMCPPYKLRNDGIRSFVRTHPEIVHPFAPPSP